MKDALFYVMFFVAWVLITGFLCAAAILNPDLNDTEQFVWSAIAVGVVTLIGFFLLAEASDD